jgi:hypothetical protein
LPLHPPLFLFLILNDHTVADATINFNSSAGNSSSDRFLITIVWVVWLVVNSRSAQRLGFSSK